MLTLVAMLGLAGEVPATEGPGQSAGRRPNIVVILADDLGYSDLGCYGGEIYTPHLDGLAAGGLRFTQFYNTARCWPTRAALLTGYHAQQVRRDTVPGVPSGSQGTRPSWARLLPEMLRSAGYRSYHSGKWHVDGMPLAGGFDRSYYVQDLGRYFQPRVLFEDDRALPPVEPGSGYDATTAIAEHAIAYLRQHAQDHAGKPFFLYLAFNAPHFPLHALPEDIARYRDRYRAGWETIRAERWRRIQELGIAAGRLSDVERTVGPPYDVPDALKRLGPGEVNRPLPWGELTDEQHAFQATKMTLHAAMVDRMDREIGRVLDQLRVMRALDDTLILFLSDNGASAEIMVRDDGHDPAAEPGSAATHLCLGPGWSTAANTPFRRHKTWVHEGGIATPLIVHWPRGIAARGELRRNPGHVIDLEPTILEVAKASRPKTWEGQPVPEPPGKSLVAAFARDGTVPHEALWWEHEGNRALRAGDWKLVAARDGPWELYDLASDRAETRDLARERPGTVRELARRWEQRRDEFLALARRDAEPRPASRGPESLHLKVVERTGGQAALVPARVHLADAGGKPVLAPDLPAWRDHFNCDGDVRLDLPPGRYTLHRRARPGISTCLGCRHDPTAARRCDAGGAPRASHRPGVPRLVLRRDPCAPPSRRPPPPAPLRGPPRRPGPHRLEQDQSLEGSAPPGAAPGRGRARPGLPPAGLRGRAARRGAALLQSRPATGAGRRRPRIPFAGRPPARGDRAAGGLGRCREAVLVGHAHLGGDGESPLDRAGQQPHVPPLDVRGRGVGPPARCRGVPASPGERLLLAVALLPAAQLRPAHPAVRRLSLGGPAQPGRLQPGLCAPRRAILV